MEEAVSPKLTGDRCQKEPRVVPQSKDWAGGLIESPERWANADRKTKSPPGRWSGAQSNSSQKARLYKAGYFPEKGMLAGSAKTGIDGFK